MGIELLSNTSHITKYTPLYPFYHRLPSIEGRSDLKNRRHRRVKPRVKSDWTSKINKTILLEDSVIQR